MIQYFGSREVAGAYVLASRLATESVMAGMQSLCEFVQKLTLSVSDLFCQVHVLVAYILGGSTTALDERAISRIIKSMVRGFDQLDYIEWHRDGVTEVVLLDFREKLKTVWPEQQTQENVLLAVASMLLILTPHIGGSTTTPATNSAIAESVCHPLHFTRMLTRWCAMLLNSELQPQRSGWARQVALVKPAFRNQGDILGKTAAVTCATTSATARLPILAATLKLEDGIARGSALSQAVIKQLHLLQTHAQVKLPDEIENVELLPLSSDVDSDTSDAIVLPATAGSAAASAATVIPSATAVVPGSRAPSRAAAAAAGTRAPAEGIAAVAPRTVPSQQGLHYIAPAVVVAQAMSSMVQFWTALVPCYPNKLTEYIS